LNNKETPIKKPFRIVEKKNRSHSQKNLLNVNCLQNNKCVQTNQKANNAISNIINNNSSLEKQKIGSFEFNIENDKLNNNNSELKFNNKFQNIRASLFNGIIEKNTKYSQKRNSIEGNVSSFRKNNRNYYIKSEKSSDLIERNFNLSFTTLNNNIIKNYLDPYYDV